MASRKFGIWDLARLMLWGVAAAAALTVVAFAGSTDVGRGRVKVAVADIREAWSPAAAKKPRMLSADEGRRLAETVRTLSADRERLLTRIAALEHDVEDITGSIVRVQKAQRDSEKTRAKEPAAPQPEAAAPPTAPAQDVTSSISAPSAASQIPMPPRPAKPEYGLDLGGAPSVEALRNAWTIAVRKHSKLLEGLEPAIHTRERPRGGGPELRLVAGPLPNAATAARLCAAMTAAGAICAPSVYDGQRLALP